MTSLRAEYGTSSGITISLASITSGGTQQSTTVDNTGNMFVDVLVQLSVKLSTGTPSGEKVIYVYVFGSEDGTRLTDNVSGTDGTITLREPTNLRLLGAIYTPDAGGLTYVSNPMSLLAAFGGLTIPRKWGIVVQNQTGVTFSGTEGDHQKTYTGIRLQTV
jgi:hypothetical protein